VEDDTQSVKQFASYLGGAAQKSFDKTRWQIRWQARGGLRWISQAGFA